MTPFRARIGEISHEAAQRTKHSLIVQQDKEIIESAILRAIEELLAREPSEQMLVQGSVPHGIITNKVAAIWRRIAAQFRKEI